jgi:hypothetical protein
MTMTLDITDDLKPDELGEMVDAAKEEGITMGKLILESSREYVRKRREQRAQGNTQRMEVAA